MDLTRVYQYFGYGGGGIRAYADSTHHKTAQSMSSLKTSSFLEAGQCETFA